MGKVIRPRQRAKVASFLAEGRSIRDTAKLTGYAPTTIQKIKKELPELIKQKREVIQARILEEGLPSIEKMVELRDTAKSEQVQFTSAKELLDRADQHIGLGQKERAVLVFNFNGSPEKTISVDYEQESQDNP